MTADVCNPDRGQQLAPPAAAPLADAKRNIQAARSALKAAVTLTPALLERVAPLHAALADIEQQLERVRP